MRTSTSTGVSPSGVAPHANLAHNWRNSKLCWLNEEEILKTLKTVVQRLGGRDYGQEPSGLRHCFICDTSRMYAERTEPRPNTAAILQATTCWSRLEVVDQTAHQQFQKVGDSMQLIAQAPTTRSTFISKELPANPKMAMEMFLDLVARQSNHGNPVLEKFISSMKRYMEVFTQLGHQQFTDSLPEPQPRYQTSKPPHATGAKDFCRWQLIDASNRIDASECSPLGDGYKHSQRKPENNCPQQLNGS